MVVWAPTWFGSTAAGGYAVTDSVWFDSGGGMTDNATPASDSNKKMTISCWAKRAKLGDGSNSQVLWSWSRDNGANDFVQLSFLGPTDKLGMTLQTTDDGHSLSFKSNAVYRDTTAWMHLLFTVDTTPSTPTWDIFVNGSSIKNDLTQDATPAIAQNQTFRFGETGSYLGVGCKANDATSSVFYGYMAEVAYQNNVVVTDASDYGELSDDGIWIPKDISDLTYGSSSFLYQFGTAPGTGNGAGTDTSGRGNHLTENDTTAARQTSDSPTNTAADNEGNYATFNALSPQAGTPTNGNLTVAISANNQNYPLNIALPSTGKWSCQFQITTIGSHPMVGLINSTDSEYAMYRVNGASISHNTSGDDGSYGATYTTTDYIDVLYDADADTLAFRKNGTSQGTAWSTISNKFTSDIFFGVRSNTASTFVVNSGQTAFNSSLASGFSALSTANLPEPTITDPSAHFQTKLWTGNGSDARALTFDGNSDLQPDLIWIKCRSTTFDHVLFDSVRGFSTSTTGTQISSNLNATQPSTTGGHVQSVQSDGFTLKNGTAGNADANVNDNTATYVGWCWKAGGAPTATNSAGAGATPTANSVKIDGSNLGSALAGTIPATKLSANTTSGLSIVAYTGTGSGGTIGHHLGKVPDMIFVKKLTNVTDATSRSWAVYHTSVGATHYGLLDSPNVFSDLNTYWNDTTPTTSVFSVLTDNAVNDSSSTYIAYCWASIEGYSKFGIYAGNSTTSTPKNGPFVYLGFKPSLVLIKSTSAAAGGSGDGGGWHMFDNVRSTYNPSKKELFADADSAEGDPGNERIDFTAQGFKIRDQYDCNGSSRDYVYAAFGATAFASNNRAK